MAYTIKDLQEGNVAVVNDGTLEELRAVMNAAFPEEDGLNTLCKYYYRNPTPPVYWYVGNIKPPCPSQSVKVFMEELQPTPEQPKPHILEEAQALLDQALQHLSIKYNTTSIGTQFFVPSSSTSGRCPQLPLENPLGKSIVKTTAPTPTTEGQPHYDNSKGSLYQFAEDHQLNAWEFDLVKRLVRCRKKGQFKEDLEKSKFLIDLYLKEHGHLYENNKN